MLLYYCRWGIKIGLSVRLILFLHLYFLLMYLRIHSYQIDDNYYYHIDVLGGDFPDMELAPFDDKTDCEV